MQVAWKVGDPKIPRPWSKHSKEKKGTEDGTKLEDNKSSSLLGSKEERDNFNLRIQDDDPKIQEFLQVTQPRINSKLWANDSLMALAADQNGKGREKPSQMKKEDGKKLELVNVDGDNDEEMQTALHNTHVSVKNSAHNDEISDMEYFKSRVKNNWSDSDTSDDENNNEDVKKEDESIKKELEIQDFKLPPETKVKGQDHSNHCYTGDLNMEKSSSTLEDKKDEVLESGRLFVRNLPYAAT